MQTLRSWSVAAALICIAVAAPASAQEKPAALAALPQLGAKIDQTSVSGISSGAYMAGQFEIAHSRLVVGAAIIAGGPYGCAQSAFSDFAFGPGATLLNVSKAVNGCMLNAMAIWGVPNPPLLVDKAKRLAEEGRIDPIENVLGDKVYLFSGREDRTVVPAIVASAVEFYQRLGVPNSQIRFVSDMPAGHAFVTEGEGLSCELTAKPFVVDCNYDQAGDLLRHIYGELQPRSTSPGGRYIAFDQRPFVRDFANDGFDEEGVVYVPQACATSAGCRVHIAFHGCAQSREEVSDQFIKDTGFARWADTNKLIVLFPQIKESPTENPQGCWDWWGYTGADFLTRDAPQIVAVYRMLERLGKAGPPQ